MTIEWTKADLRLSEEVRPAHSCRQCEREIPPAPNSRNRCRVLIIEEQCNEATRTALKRRRLWRGEAHYQGTLATYARLSTLIEGAGGKFNPRWPYRTAVLARAVLSARAQAYTEVANQAKARQVPTVASVRKQLYG